MTQKRIIIWGATGQAIMLEEILRNLNISISAFFDNNKSVKSPFIDIPIYYDKRKITEYKDHYFAVAIGGSHGMDRVTISEELIRSGLIPIQLIHTTAYISSGSTLEEGVQILPMAKICARVIIGKFSIINTGASIDHECNLGKGIHIAPNAVLCGCVKVGNYSFIGANATILPRLEIGNNVIIGAGAVVTKNIPDNTVFVGNPASKLKGYD